MRYFSQLFFRITKISKLIKKSVSGFRKRHYLLKIIKNSNFNQNTSFNQILIHLLQIKVSGKKFPCNYETLTSNHAKFLNSLSLNAIWAPIILRKRTPLPEAVESLNSMSHNLFLMVRWYICLNWWCVRKTHSQPMSATDIQMWNYHALINSLPNGKCGPCQ